LRKVLAAEVPTCCQHPGHPVLRCMTAHGMHGPVYPLRADTADTAPDAASEAAPDAIPAPVLFASPTSALSLPPLTAPPPLAPAAAAPTAAVSRPRSAGWPLQLARTAPSVSLSMGPARTMKFQKPLSSVSGRITYAYMTCADDSANSSRSPWLQSLPQKWNRLLAFWLL